MTDYAPPQQHAHVIVAGAGAIGSHALPLVARMPAVTRITVVDRDVYETGNLAGQAIEADDVGRPKALAQVERLRRIRPDLEVTAWPSDLHQVPLGALHGDAILGCLDSREARRFLHQAAWRLGVPYIDAGVLADGLLARVSVFHAGPDAPCLECGWSARDYDLLEQTYPCEANVAPGGHGEAGTNAPAALGALAASMQALLCGRLLAGAQLAGNEVLLDAAGQRHFAVHKRRNPACRFDHETWRIETFRCPLGSTRLEHVLALAPGDEVVRLSVDQSVFARILRCEECRTAAPLLCLLGRPATARHVCQRCGGRLVAGGMDVVDEISMAQLTPPQRRQSLLSIGFEERDVLTLAAGEREIHVELVDLIEDTAPADAAAVRGNGRIGKER